MASRMREIAQAFEAEMAPLRAPLTRRELRHLQRRTAKGKVVNAGILERAQAQGLVPETYRNDYSATRSSNIAQVDPRLLRTMEETLKWQTIFKVPSKQVMNLFWAVYKLLYGQLPALR